MFLLDVFDIEELDATKEMMVPYTLLPIFNIYELADRLGIDYKVILSL